MLFGPWRTWIARFGASAAAGRPEPSWHCDRFLGKVPHRPRNMKHIYSSCDVFLKMSEVEAFFLPPMEMMACGQGACVLGEVTGIEEYVEDGVNALVVKQGDVAGARRAVQRLMDDEPLRRRLMANGLKDGATVRMERLDRPAPGDLLLPAAAGAVEGIRPPGGLNAECSGRGARGVQERTSAGRA